MLQRGCVSGKHRNLFDGAVSITGEQDAAETNRVMFTAQPTVAGNATRTNDSTASSVNTPMNSEFIWTGIVRNNEGKEEKDEE